MLQRRNTSVTATRFVRALNGGSQPMLVDASDGRQYVVKFANNPQGQNVLCNEVLGAELYRALGLPAPEWRPVLITQNFLLRNPNCRMTASGSRIQPEAGLCFGSCAIGQPNGRIFEMLPGSFLRRVTNRPHFWLAWLADICAEHRDNRQCIFIENSGVLQAVFLDHGHMFGGPDGSLKTPLMGPRYWDTRVYAVPDLKKMRMQLRQISSSLDTDRLLKAIQEAPEAWFHDSALKNFFVCIERLSRSDYLDETAGRMLAAAENLNERAFPQLERSGHPALLRPCLPSEKAGRPAFA